MKPTNNSGEIFPCNNCGNHAQPTPQASNRKKVIFHDYNNNLNYYLELTDSQTNLLDWLIKENFLDGEFEFMADMDFVAP